jgi:signal transduction histidine kinase
MFDVVIYPAGRLLEACLPIAIGIAILKHRLFDIDVILNRTLVYGALSGLIAGTYILIVGGLGSLLEGRGSLALSLGATGLIAVLFQPLRDHLQRRVNHLLYGDRDDPYAVISRLGGRLEAALAPDALLPALVSTVRDALKLTYAAVVLHGERVPAASAGISPPGDTLALPLTYAGDPVGELILGPRGPGEALTIADRRLLDDLAHQAGAAVHAVRLTADLRALTRELQGSRERLVLAREEERRRLRRDLHDDLAPSLAALALTASTAADLIEYDPVAAREMVKDLTAAIRASVADIRRLVYDLRPPTLDELGLVAAIRERAARYDGSVGVTGEPLHVSVEAPDRLGPLSAAVEVAAYRMIQEALMNVVRHAQAREAHITVTCEGEEMHSAMLVVAVVDDGVGLPAFGEDGAHRRGVGLRSMQERAAELGGRCVIERKETGGTRVQAWLPVHSFPKEEKDGALPDSDR